MTLGGLALGGRHPGGRCDGHDREHQLPSGAGQGDRGRRSWTAPSQIVVPATVSLLCISHRLRADVHAWAASAGYPVPAAGGSGRVRTSIGVLRPVADVGADHGQLPAQSGHHRPRATRMARSRNAARNPLVLFPAWLRAALRDALRRGYARDCSSLALGQSRLDDRRRVPRSDHRAVLRAWCRISARTSFRPISTRREIKHACPRPDRHAAWRK